MLYLNREEFNGEEEVVELYRLIGEAWARVIGRKRMKGSNIVGGEMKNKQELKFGSNRNEVFNGTRNNNNYNNYNNQNNILPNNCNNSYSKPNKINNYPSYRNNNNNKLINSNFHTINNCHQLNDFYTTKTHNIHSNNNNNNNNRNSSSLYNKHKFD